MAQDGTRQEHMSVPRVAQAEEDQESAELVRLFGDIERELFGLRELHSKDPFEGLTEGDLDARLQNIRSERDKVCIHIQEKEVAFWSANEALHVRYEQGNVNRPKEDALLELYEEYWRAMSSLQTHRRDLEAVYAAYYEELERRHGQALALKNAPVTIRREAQLDVLLELRHNKPRSGEAHMLSVYMPSMTQGLRRERSLVRLGGWTVREGVEVRYPLSLRDEAEAPFLTRLVHNVVRSFCSKKSAGNEIPWGAVWETKIGQQYLARLEHIWAHDIAIHAYTQERYTSDVRIDYQGKTYTLPSVRDMMYLCNRKYVECATDIWNIVDTQISLATVSLGGFLADSFVHGSALGNFFAGRYRGDYRMFERRQLYEREMLQAVTDTSTLDALSK